MVTETIPETQVDQSVEEAPTETPSPIEQVGVEGAAEPSPEEAATVPQVEVTEEKPDYLTREEWEKEKAELSQRAAQEALEADRRRRQTEGARKAQAEERQKLRLSQAADTVKATLISRGIDPDAATDQAVVTAIDRVAQERADALVKERGDVVGEAWDYITAPVYGQQAELDDSFAEVARILSPKVQHLINQITPVIEAKAREGYILESDLPKKVDEEIARRQAKAREGQTELARPEGQPASPIDNSDEARTNRIISNDATEADREWWQSRFGKKG